MQEYGQSGVTAGFGRSLGLFESVVTELSGPDAAARTHADLEVWAVEQGRELTRLLVQDHLDLRAVREVRRDDVAGGDGIARTRVERDHERELATLVGPVTVRRLAYRAPRQRNTYPADEVLSLPVEKHSFGLRRLAVVESVRGSFADAGAAIGRITGNVMGKRQVECLAQAAAVDIDGFYAARRPEPVAAEQVLALTFDGKGIVVRPEALREATAKAAAAGKQKYDTRLSPGEKRGRKRMAELCCVYDAKPMPRVPGDIIGRTGDAARRRGPIATGKWLTASVIGDTTAVVKAGFDEAIRRDADRKRPWVVLVDGHPHQIDAIKAEARARRKIVTIVVDFVHVLEYIWAAAWSFHDKGDPDAETWVATQAVKVLEGKARTVATAISRQADKAGLNTTQRKNADDAANYLTSKSRYLDYPFALAAGWPIATGVIEGACRYLVKDRMDITGARWGLAGAEAVLTLRALISNGDLDDYWDYHLEQEHNRNHQTDRLLVA